MVAWRGHSYVTSFVLRSLIRKATAGRSELSRDERLLYTACEFWAAVAARSLLPLLGSGAGAQLRAFAEVLEEIGSVRTASVLRRASFEFDGTKSPQWLRRAARALETRLLAVDESVDATLARFAVDRIVPPLIFDKSTDAPDRAQ